MRSSALSCQPLAAQTAEAQLQALQHRLQARSQPVKRAGAGTAARAVGEDDQRAEVGAQELPGRGRRRAGDPRPVWGLSMRWRVVMSIFLRFLPVLFVV